MHPPEVRVMLVLESELPEEYRTLATALGVSYIEGVTPGVAQSSA
ncbi:protein of unknown function [Caballeronia sp. S22]